MQSSRPEGSKPTTAWDYIPYTIKKTDLDPSNRDALITELRAKKVTHLSVDWDDLKVPPMTEEEKAKAIKAIMADEKLSAAAKLQAVSNAPSMAAADGLKLKVSAFELAEQLVEHVPTIKHFLYQDLGFIHAECRGFLSRILTVTFERQRSALFPVSIAPLASEVFPLPEAMSAPEALPVPAPPALPSDASDPVPQDSRFDASVSALNEIRRRSADQEQPKKCSLNHIAQRCVIL